MSINVIITLHIDTPEEMTDFQQLQETLRSYLTREIAILNPQTRLINYRKVSIAKYEVK